MAGVNKAILLGRLGKDPEVRNLENGSTVANFNIATTETYKDKTTGERKEITEWHHIVVWRGLADVAAKYLHKGDLVYIEGRIRTRSWEKDNITRYITEVVADTMNLLSPKGSGAAAAAPPPTQEYPAPKHIQEDFKPASGSSTDDLPF